MHQPLAIHLGLVNQRPAGAGCALWQSENAGTRLVIARPKALAVFVVAVWISTSVASTGGVVRDDFEGPDVSLSDAGGDAYYRIDNHARVPHGAHSGQWCERLTVRGNNGTHVYLSHSLPPARVISEVTPSVWIKADRPGLQLLVRVTLPRSANPQTGKPLTALVRGTTYSNVGVWQQLRLENLMQSLQRQVRVLRIQHATGVDAREAYVDRILLNVYGGPGVTNVLVDDLEVSGIVSPQGKASTVSAVTRVPGPIGAPHDPPLTWAGRSGVPKVERSGSLLLVDGKPFFPRIIEYRGEPPARLKALGFNGLWLARAPTSELLRAAAAAGMWVIAPPPPVAALRSRAASGGQIIGSQLDPVLAWDLGHGLVDGHLKATREWAKLVQLADPRARPMICEPESNLKAYSRPPIHLLLARRDVLGTSVELNQYTAWLRQRSHFTLPGTILCASIQTRPPARLVEQMALLSRGRAPRIAFQESQIRTLVHAALAGGARALFFQSSARLDARDEYTRRLAAILELVNLQLDLIERWPATGHFSTTADSSDPHAVGAVIETDRSRLLLPMYTPPGSQLVMGAASGSVVNYTVGGVPEEDNAYELSLVSFRPLSSQRVTGGTRVLLGELERDSLVVFTQDQTVIHGLHERLNRNRRRAAELLYQIATLDQVEVEVVGQRLAALGHDIAAAGPLRIAAQNDFREFGVLAGKGDLPGAYYRARHALAALRLIQRFHFDEATSGGGSLLADPWTANFATLDAHLRFNSELASTPRGPNTLPEGGCEDLKRMMAAGWKHWQHLQDNITSAVDLSGHAAHSGAAGLRLRAVATDAGDRPNAVESPPMWVTTAAVPVERGQLLEIQGWVRIAQPIVGSVDGLLVIDTLGGEPLAQRFSQAAQWQPFTVYRAVGQSGTVALTFALTGLGEAWIDDVSIRVVAHRGAAGPQHAQQVRQPPLLSRDGS